MDPTYPSSPRNVTRQDDQASHYQPPHAVNFLTAAVTPTPCTPRQSHRAPPGLLPSSTQTHGPAAARKFPFPGKEGDGGEGEGKRRRRRSRNNSMIPLKQVKKPTLWEVREIAQYNKGQTQDASLPISKAPFISTLLSSGSALLCPFDL